MRLASHLKAGRRWLRKQRISCEPRNVSATTTTSDGPAASIRVEPDTKMPTYFNGENSVLPTILEGKAEKQINALWNYLLQGEAIEPPGN